MLNDINLHIFVVMSIKKCRRENMKQLIEGVQGGLLFTVLRQFPLWFTVLQENILLFTVLKSSGKFLLFTVLER